jgi:hypothetical protein
MHTEVDERMIKKWLRARLMVSLTLIFFPVASAGMLVGLYLSGGETIGHTLALFGLFLTTYVSGIFVRDAVSERYARYDKWCDYMREELRTPQQCHDAKDVMNDYLQAHAPPVQDA